MLLGLHIFEEVAIKIFADLGVENYKLHGR